MSGTLMKLNLNVVSGVVIVSLLLLINSVYMHQHHHHHQQTQEQLDDDQGFQHQRQGETEHEHSHYYHRNNDGTIGTTATNPRWLRTEVMDGNGLYILDWRIQSKEIYFRVTVNTRGFIGLGFSLKTGKMLNADLIMAWVDDRTGKPTVLDCHGGSENDGNVNGMPIQDDTQNYIVDAGYQNATHTQIQFHRQLETCDPHDIILSADTIKVMWCYGEKDPMFNKITGHGTNRGYKSLHLMAPKARRPPHSPDVRQWDITMKNISIQSNMDTLYWCKIFKAPILQDKHHIIGYEPLLSKDTTTATNKKSTIVHHMTLFECNSSSYPGSDPSSWDIWVSSNGAVCNSNLLTPRDWDSCITPIASWSIGSTGQFLPENVGVPMGGRIGSKYYMLEIHYDNPNAKKVMDHSGFRLHYTRRLRKNDGGMMISGVSVSDTQMIPPHQKLYRNVGICGPSCTNSVFPETGIKIVSATLHSHLAGRRMKLRHVRDGQELNRIVEDDNYDYNYQQFRQLINETVVLPGDYLITECGYETTKRRRLTFGGYSTKQEMCLSFITYYPKIDLAGCYSMTPVVEFFETFGVYQFFSMNMTDVENLFLYNGNVLDLLPTTIIPDFPPGGHINDENNKMFIEALLRSKEYSIVTGDETDDGGVDALQQESILNKLIISDPVEFHGRTFLQHLYQLPWTEHLFTRRIEQAMVMGKHMTFCRVSNETLSLSAEIIRYPNFTGLVREASQCPYQHLIESHLLNSASTRLGGKKQLLSKYLASILVSIFFKFILIKKFH